MRKKPYSETDLFDSHGTYGSVNRNSIGLMIFGTVIGWGFVTNTFASWLSWQGYFLDVIGGKKGAWAYSNIGVIFALLIGFFGHVLLAGKRIKQQESV
jgi:steroid 5-alpha reductase family enzyme